MKRCYVCKEVKSLSLYSKNKRCKDGLQADCKSCRSIAKKKYLQENKEKVKEARKSYKIRNKHKVKALERLRLKGIKKALPKWANNALIKNYYDVCRFFNDVNGYTKYHVDHIVPLSGKTVCGLHVHNNLQVIPAKDNLAKGNRFEQS